VGVASVKKDQLKDSNLGKIVIPVGHCAPCPN